VNNFDQEFAKLNPAQKEAAENIYGPVIVMAVPGSGKTQLLAMHIGQILKTTDTLPSSILCLSFTEAAASNMRKRLFSLIGQQAHQVAFHTFHSFGSEVINQNPEEFFFGASFSPIDELGQYQILRQIFENLNWENPLRSYHPEQDYIYLSGTLSAIQKLKQAGISPIDLVQIIQTNTSFLNEVTEILPKEFNETTSKKHFPIWQEFVNKCEEIAAKNIQRAIQKNYDWLKIFPTLAETFLIDIQLANHAVLENEDKKPITTWKNSNLEKNNLNLNVFKETKKLKKQAALVDIYTKYQQEIHKQGLYDFADMLMQVVAKMEDKINPELAYNLQEKYQYILVDEFQDTNGVQLRLLLNLLNSNIPDYQPNILVVGDDDQAIYKFQGANIQNLWKFKQSFPQSKEIGLNLNYRSNQDILDIASLVINQASQRFSKELGINKQLISALPKKKTS
jgi:DNA helicase II / ATP-dependent DNA helicase PcrA